jgi:hypothetical protein
LASTSEESPAKTQRRKGRTQRKQEGKRAPGFAFLPFPASSFFAAFLCVFAPLREILLFLLF